MQKIHELCSWCSFFLILSLSIITSTLMGLIVLGLVPAMRSGLYTIEVIFQQEGALAPTKVFTIYWKQFFNEFKSCLRLSLFLALLVGLQYSLGVLFQKQLSWGTPLNILSFLLFISYSFLLLAAILHEDHQVGSSILYLLTQTPKVMLSLIIVLAVVVITVSSSFPIWLLSIGLLCYLLLVVRRFTYQGGAAKTADDGGNK